MRTGRPKHADPPVNWKLSIPSSLAAEFELITADLMTGVPAKGIRSKIMQELIRGFIAAYATGESTINVGTALRHLK